MSTSSENESAVLPEHIFVLVHGNNGSPNDLSKITERIEKQYRGNVLCIQIKSNCGQTHLGVQIGGRNVAREVLEVIDSYESNFQIRTHKFSMIGHSLGGLYIRFSVLDIMKGLKGTPIEYVSFTTLCTPHLGSRRPGGTRLKVIIHFFVNCCTILFV